MQANLPWPLFSKRGKERRERNLPLLKREIALLLRIMLTVKPRDSGPATS
jgi:hypothetical protein